MHRHRASGRGVVRLNGRDVYCGVWPSDLKNPPPEVTDAYRKAIAEWLAGATVATVPRGEAVAQRVEGVPMFTVVELLASFWQFAERTYAGPEGTTEKASYAMTLRILKRLYADLPCVQFTPLKLRAVREEFIRQGWNRTNVNAHTRRVKRIFRWGVEHELVPPSVITGLGAVAGLRRGSSEVREAKIVKPVDDATLTATLPHLPPPVANLVQLLRLCGARVGELCRMRPVDIDQTGETWIYRPIRHKTASRGHARAIAFGPRARALVAPIIAGLDQQAFVFSPARWVAAQNAERSAKRQTKRWKSHMERNARKRKAVPERKPREAYTPITVAQAVARACCKAFKAPKELSDDEVKEWEKTHRWHPHQIRHAFGTEARRVAGIESASAGLGHSSLATSQIYARADETLASQLAERIG